MGSLERTLSLLMKIGENPLSVSEAADYLGLHKSSASRMLSALGREGFVELNDNRKYEIGLAVLHLASKVTGGERLLKRAHPFLVELNRLIDETVHLAVLNGTNITYIDKIEPSRMIQMNSKVGLSVPLYKTGVGKVLLSYQSPSVQSKLLSEILSGSHTIADIPKFKDDLGKTYLTGIAYNWGEHDEHINCIAAPVFRFDGKIVASVSIAAPIFFTGREKLVGYAPALLSCVKKISERLGYTKQIPPVLQKAEKL